MSGGGFYLGSWFVQEFETANQSDWQLPQNEEGHLRSTANVEELWAYPENMDLVPEEIQLGPIELITFSPPQQGFYVQALGPFGFYLQSKGPFGFYLQSIGI